MRPTKVSGVVVEGHKGCAVEVPWEPPESARALSIRPGRRGYRVLVTAAGQTFESWLVGRSSKFWLLLDEPQLAALGAGIGDEVVLGITLVQAPVAKPKRRIR